MPGITNNGEKVEHAGPGLAQAVEQPQTIEVLDKTIRIVEGLAGREYEPMSLQELTERSGLDKSGILRILRTLEANGWAEQRDKLWRLTARFIRLAEEYRIGRDRYFAKLDERDRNYLGRVD